MAKYAKGKKSYAISDRGGQRVRYTQLKTTWDGLRVAPDEWEPKHPQLTPVKNIIDSQQLFKPRSTGQDREDVVIYLAHTFDPFTSSVERKSIGAAGLGTVGEINSDDISLLILETGTAGTGAVGTETVELSIAEAGVAGTGATGVELGFLEVTGNSGSGGAGGVGVEALNLSITETGVAGTGAVGTETIQIPAWGVGTWGSGTWGN